VSEGACLLSFSSEFDIIDGLIVQGGDEKDAAGMVGRSRWTSNPSNLVGRLLFPTLAVRSPVLLCCSSLSGWRPKED
jgi:hypothetical protein